MSLMEIMLLSAYLLTLMFGLMVTLSRIRCLVPHLLALGFMLMSLAGLGGTGVAVDSCRSFCSVLGPPQAVQMAELWRREEE